MQPFMPCVGLSQVPYTIVGITQNTCSTHAGTAFVCWSCDTRCSLVLHLFTRRKRYASQFILGDVSLRSNPSSRTYEGRDSRLAQQVDSHWPTCVLCFGNICWFETHAYN
ncbi:hypothetical protein WJX77_001543 [Trebouxia sp. C0004]